MSSLPMARAAAMIISIKADTSGARVRLNWTDLKWKHVVPRFDESTFLAVLTVG